MSIANEIISGRVPNYDRYLREGYSLDDIDEYGFTPLIECAITNRIPIAEELLSRKVDVNKPDVGGRTALHWAIDNSNLKLAELLLSHKANPNAYTTYSMPVLVYPLLRNQNTLKQLLYRYGAKLDFALDFINGKLLGHRFELTGDVDILTANNEFVELDFEGFMLEFTVAAVQDSLRRFIASYSTRHLRDYFLYLKPILQGFQAAAELLRLQQHPFLTDEDKSRLESLIKSPMLILPAASRGHALCFIRYNQWWAKIDRGENSLKEGSVNIYRLTHPDRVNVKFLQNFLYSRQPREYFHQVVNQHLGLVPILKLPIRSQIAGNCSWANVQAVVPTAYALQLLNDSSIERFNPLEAVTLYNTWIEWDKDRALQECIYRFYHANPLRQASLASMLAAVLFQTCNASNLHHIERAEKILAILTIPNFYYILSGYLKEYCVKRLTPQGNNLLKLLEECGVNPGIDVTPIATDLKEKD